MTVFRGWTISVGLVLAATAAAAQNASPPGTSRPGYVATSDFSGPYADVPPGPPPAVVYGPQGYGSSEYGGTYAPSLLPPREVYTVLREHGFSPLGPPQLRGTVYSIVVVDRRGDDGRLLVDARTGQIVRFVPAYRMGNRFEGGPTTPYGYGYGYGPAPMSYPAGPPRPPVSLPREASRVTPTVPVPRAAPPRIAEQKSAPDRPVAEKPAPQALQQSAAVQGKAAEAPPQAAAPAAEAKPAAPAILPTQPMPKVQGLE